MPTVKKNFKDFSKWIYLWLFIGWLILSVGIYFLLDSLDVKEKVLDFIFVFIGTFVLPVYLFAIMGRQLKEMKSDIGEIKDAILQNKCKIKDVIPETSNIKK